MKKALITIITFVIVISAFVSCSNEAIEPEILEDGSIVLNRTITTWKTGTYVLNRNIMFSDKTRITVEGDVTLILNEGCRMISNQGITVNEGSKLTINGSGELWASNYGDNDDSAIGSRDRKDAGTIVINGGTIKAYATYWKGNNYGAAIGGGNHGSCESVIITGGSVKAVGGEYASGIGGGYTREGANVRIEGGSIDVEAGALGDPASSSIGHGGNLANEDGELYIDDGITVMVSDDGEKWGAYSTERKRYMKTV